MCPTADGEHQSGLKKRARKQRTYYSFLERAVAGVPVPERIVEVDEGTRWALASTAKLTSGIIHDFWFCEPKLRIVVRKNITDEFGLAVGRRCLRAGAMSYVVNTDVSVEHAALLVYILQDSYMVNGKQLLGFKQHTF